ncbi:MAG: heavy-metal-associated domain-containing protein [Chloroflexi bacterium]|nr:heavy-metal-associated domain-containing protein [Chloroflexota bacterium]
MQPPSASPPSICWPRRSWPKGSGRPSSSSPPATSGSMDARCRPTLERSTCTLARRSASASVPWRGSCVEGSAPSIERRVFAVEGMTCASCVAHVERALRSVAGVTAA